MSMSRLPIKALEAFEATARTGSLARAAREVNLSISAVSHHLSRLEATLGTALLDRTRRPVRLTAAGADALRRIEEGLRQIRLAAQVTDPASVLRPPRAVSRPLRIGLPGATHGPLGPRLAAALAGAAPGRRLTILGEPGYRAVRLVQLRRLDAAVSDDPPRPPPGLLRRPLLLQPLVLALPRDLDLPAERVVQGDADLPLLLLGPKRPLGRQIRAHLRRLGVPLAHRHEVDDSEAVGAMVAAGLGFGVLPATACLSPRLDDHRVALQPLPGGGAVRPVSLYARRDGAQGVPDIARVVFERAHHVVRRDVMPALAERLPWLVGALAPPESECP